MPAQSPYEYSPLQGQQPDLLTLLPVIGECYLDKSMKSAAILGQLPEDYELVTTFLKDKSADFDAYLNRWSGKIQLDDPRFEKLRSERGMMGQGGFLCGRAIPGVEETTSTHARGGGGIRMKVSALDDAEEVLVMGIDLKPFDLL